MNRRRSIPLFFLCIPAVGCEDLSSFSTAPNEVYRGDIIQPEEVRKGFGRFSRLELTLDMAKIDESPGTMTVVSRDELGGEEIIFDAALLAPISSLKYDALSGIDFPTGRLKNYILVATVSSARFSGAEAIIVLSLMSNGSVEVRIISGRDSLFGIFSLKKETR